MHATTSRNRVSALLGGAVLLVCATAQAQTSGAAGSGQPNMTGAPYGVTTPGGTESTSGSTSGTSGMSGAGTTSGTTGTTGTSGTSGATGGTYDQGRSMGTYPSATTPSGADSLNRSGTGTSPMGATGSGTLHDSGSTQGTPQGATDTTQGTTSGASDAGGSSSGIYDSSSATPMAFDPPAAGYSSRGNNYSWLPYTTRGYVGLHWGQSDFDDVRCSSFYSCDDTGDKAFKVYTGGMFNDFFGLELGYLNTGSVDRSGGRTRAHGANVSVIAQMPLGQVAGIYAKAGMTYAWTRTSTGPLAVDVNGGKDSGAGPSYGAGLRFNATPNWALVLEWERHEMRFAGDSKRDVSLTTLGVQYRF